MHRLLQQIAPPNLPLAGDEYTAKYQDQLNNVFRLYLNQINTLVSNVIGVNGGQYVDCPNGLFFDLGTYSPALANTGYPLQFGQTYLNNGVSIVDGTKLTVEIPGVYNFQYSSAVTSTNSSIKTVWLWIVRNSIPIQYSTNEYTVSGSGTDTVISWQFNLDLDAGEYVELYWGADDTNVMISTTAPTPPHTGIPANVVAVNFIAPLPEERPTPP